MLKEVDKMEEIQDLELRGLDYFIGSERYYKLMDTLITDGIKYIMNNGYSWLITDALIVIKTKLINEEFLSIKLQVNKEKNTAIMLITDGNNRVLYKQYYNYTDAKRDLTLFFENNTLMLNSEY